MKKLISKDFTVDPNRLFKPSSRTLEHLQEAYGEVIDRLGRKMIGSSPSGGYIMEGVVDTVTGSNHSITAGSILFYLNFTAWSNVTTYAQFATVSKGGFSYVSLQTSNLNNDPSTSPTYWNRVGKHQEVQLFLVDAQSFTPLVDTIVAYIDTTYIAGDPATFTDGSTANVHATYKIKFKDDATGTGIADFDNINIISSTFYSVAGGIGFQNSWADDTGGNSGARYRVEDRFLVLAGRIVGGADGTVAFTLPAKYSPQYLQQIAVLGIGGGGAYSFNKATIDTNGDVTLNWATNGNVTLDGIRIPLN